jgi:hypothetical protein
MQSNDQVQGKSGSINMLKINDLPKIEGRPLTPDLAEGARFSLDTIGILAILAVGCEEC